MATHRLQRAAAEVAVVLEGWGWTPAWAARLPAGAVRILWEYPEERTLTARSFEDLCGLNKPLFQVNMKASLTTLSLLIFINYAHNSLVIF